MREHLDKSDLKKNIAVTGAQKLIDPRNKLRKHVETNHSIKIQGEIDILEKKYCNNYVQ